MIGPRLERQLAAALEQGVQGAVAGALAALWERAARSASGRTLVGQCALVAVTGATLGGSWKTPMSLALGRALVSTADAGTSNMIERVPPPSRMASPAVAGPDGAAVQTAQISLIQPLDLYSRVDRATKYGFLFIGFTFLALLMFEIIGGARVSIVEYLLMGAALVMFFILLLAFAEVIGFTPAYILAAGAVAGLNTAYSAAVLGSWRRAAFIGGLLVGLYAVLYVLLSLEAYSLLIGSLLSFAALAGVMYATRRIDWGAPRDIGVAAA